MTAVEIATGIIDKLQEENRALLDTLHKAQDQLKQQDGQLAKKDQLINSLEEKVRRGNDGILEMTNRQKELTIKHLEMQVETLLKENEGMESHLDNIKSNICVKCETKLLTLENKENIRASKLKRPAPSTSKVLLEKKSSQNLCPNRIKSLERIIEHKDKRIAHLSKEVQRLAKSEKELTEKTYRLSKLLPMSHLPSETLTDCLLQEIQLLEAQNQRGGMSNKDIFGVGSKSSERDTVANKLSKSSITNLKRSLKNLQKDSIDESDIAAPENEVLRKKLKQLCEDVNDLKRLFLRQSEKLSGELSSTSSEYTRLKEQLQDLISSLSEVVHKMCGHRSLSQGAESDDKFVISNLQDRLKESLQLVFEYENEIITLNEKVSNLKKEIAEKDLALSSRSISSPSTSKETLETSDVKKLREILKTREAQLEAANQHISACERFIEELQKTYKHKSIYDFKLQNLFNGKQSVTASEAANHQHLKNKLDVSEKTIEKCKGFIETQQKTIKKLEEENDKLENELLKLKRTQNVMLADSQTKQPDLNKLIAEETEKVDSLKEKIKKLELELSEHDHVKTDLEAANKEKEDLNNRVLAFEKQISSLEKYVEDLQEKLHAREEKCSELEFQIQQIRQMENLADKYQSDVNALKNELEMKEEENNDLKQSLQDLEIKAMEMNHFKKSLHEEIEKLCSLIMEHDNSENDHSKRRAVYRAAVLHSAKALLNLDEDFNVKEGSFAGNTSALEELRHQIEVYLTEVSRIHELLTIKEQRRDELLREYLNDDDQPVSSSERISGQTVDVNLPSSSTLNGINVREKDPLDSYPGPTDPAATASGKAVFEVEMKMLQEEIATTKSVIAYMVSSCTRLEDLLVEEKTERAKCAAQLESHKETVKDLKLQLNTKNSMIKRLNSLIEMMRSKESNDEITLEQLKSEIKWLVEENQKIFDKVTKTQTELCHFKEKNAVFENDLDSLKRQLLNEKYAHSKVLNELKHLRTQISQCTSVMLES